MQDWLKNTDAERTRPMNSQSTGNEDDRAVAKAHIVNRRDTFALLASGLALPMLGGCGVAQATPAVPSSTSSPTAAAERKVHILRAHERYLRRSGTSGVLSAGFWRTHVHATRGDVEFCKPDGSCPVGKGSRTPNNESNIVIEGTGVITELANGVKQKIEAGLMTNNSKNIEVIWDIDAPYLKKFFVTFNSTNPPEGGANVYGDANDNPRNWRRSRWNEPLGGPQHHGEAYLVRRDTAPHTMLTGIWRAGVGIAGGTAQSTPIVCSAAKGDISLYILEGRFRIRNEETNEEYEVKAGEGVGLCEGLRTTWIPLTPFVKTYFVVTKDSPFVTSANR